MMQKKLVGRDAASRKYDLLTALAISALAKGKGSSVSTLRLIVLLTARYNWRADDVSIGQAELAELWSVNLRTVKREMKRFRDEGVLTLKRPGARGRVSVYSLDHKRIEDLTAPFWERGGGAFKERLSEQAAQEDRRADLKVVKFPSPHGNTIWDRTMRILAAEDPVRFNAWFKDLSGINCSPGMMTIQAPSPFHAARIEQDHMMTIERALTSVEPGRWRIRVVS